MQSLKKSACMKRLITILLFFIAFSALAQPVQVNRYEYWFNRQTEDRIVADITPAEQASVQLNIPTVNLPDGLNSFTIRFRDNEDLWSTALTRFFVKMPQNQDGDNTNRLITALQYRFNQGEMIRQDVTPGATFSFEQSLSAASVPNGLNSFSIRFRDNTGLWSSMVTRFFVKMPVTEDGNGDARQIVSYEYRFNQGEMVQQTVTAAADISIDEIISAAALPDGLNSFSVRFKDNAGLWSSVLTRFFVKIPALQGGGEGNDLAAYQLWLNDDFAGMQLIPIESGASFSMVENLSAADLPNGLNRVNIRFRDEKGLWSTVITRFFVKNPIAQMQGENLMTAWEYWLEDMEGNLFDHNGQKGRTYVALEEPINPMLLDMKLDLRMIPKGEYHLMFRFLDTRGNWSSVLSREIDKTFYPWAVINTPETEICGSGSILFSNFSVDTDTWLWDFGDGQQSTVFDPEHTFEQPGTYTVSLTASDHDTGIQHTTSLVINIYPEYELIQEHRICEGDTFTWFGEEYTIAGTYTHQLKTQFGCDSLFVLELQVSAVDISVEQQGNVLLALAQDAQFQWINCKDGSNVEGETHASFTPGQSGDYAVWVSQNDCTALSECYEILVSRISASDIFPAVSVYPNPSRNNLNVVFDEMQENFSVALYSLSGQRLLHTESLSGNRYTLSLENLHAGVYVLRIGYRGYHQVIKVVKE